MRIELAFPLLGLTDEYGRQIGYAALMGPARTESERRQVERVAAHHRLVGLTSYLSFPARRHGTLDPLAGRCVAWAHCFRSPDRYLPAGVPRTLLSHADFTDPRIVDAARVPGKPEKIYDFIYVCQSGQATKQIKNWRLARRCLPVLCGELKLRGLLVGRPAIADLPTIPDPSLLTVAGELPWTELMRRLAESRFLFVPNELDAAPRIIAEALATDVPVLVNRRILGGWHLVTPFSGAFFTGPHDVAAGAVRCLRHRFSPRRWFAAHHGPLRAGAQMARLLREIDPTLLARRVHLTRYAELPEGR